MVRSAKGTVEEPGKNVAQKAGLNRSILDAAWRRAMTFTVYKAAEAGKLVIFVVAKNTSRTCPKCRHVSKENRVTQADFLCVKCGHADHADTNAAVEILYRAQLGLASAA
jgi:putative transposase